MLHRRLGIKRHPIWPVLFPAARRYDKLVVCVECKRQGILMREIHYLQLDVFTNRVFGGNQLAVFLDAEGVSAEAMQLIAREMNFSESTFVLPATDPKALARVRIFTPSAELPFAGHPVVGTTFALAHQRRIRADAISPVQLELGVGLLP